MESLKALSNSSGRIANFAVRSSDDGVETHTGFDLAAAAVKDAVRNAGLSVDHVTMLGTGTTNPDIQLPGTASMVHAKLGKKPAKIVSLSKCNFERSFATTLSHDCFVFALLFFLLFFPFFDRVLTSSLNFKVMLEF